MPPYSHVERAARPDRIGLIVVLAWSDMFANKVVSFVVHFGAMIALHSSLPRGAALVTIADPAKVELRRPSSTSA